MGEESADSRAKELGQKYSLSNDPAEHLVIIQALGATGGEQAARELKDIYDRGGTVDEQLAAIHALGQVGGPFAVDTLKSIHDNAPTGSWRQTGAAGALSRLGVSGEPGAAETAELTARVQTARSEFDDLRTKIVKLPVYAEIAEIASQVEELDSTVQSLRNRGYAFQTELEDKIKELTQLWQQTQAQVMTAADSQSATLSRAATQTEHYVMQAMGGNPEDVLRAEASVQSLHDQIELVESMLKERYAGLGATIASVQDHLESMLWTLDMIDQVPGDLEQQGDELGSSLNGQVEALGRDFQALRSRAVFTSDFESRIARLSTSWQETRDEVTEAIPAVLGELRDATVQFEKQAVQRIGGVDDGSQVGASTEILDRRLAAIRSKLADRYNALSRDGDTIKAELSSIHESLDQLDQASFELAPDERLAGVAQARLLEHAADDEGPMGNLFLTDRRILFEQAETVVTKRFLVFPTKSEVRRQILFETQLEHVRSATSRDEKKLLGLVQRELLDLRLDDSAPRHEITLELFGTTNEEWVALIEKARQGELKRTG